MIWCCRSWDHPLRTTSQETLKSSLSSWYFLLVMPSKPSCFPCTSFSLRTKPQIHLNLGDVCPDSFALFHFPYTTVLMHGITVFVALLANICLFFSGYSRFLSYPVSALMDLRSHCAMFFDSSATNNIWYITEFPLFHWKFLVLFNEWVAGWPQKMWYIRLLTGLNSSKPQLTIF